MADAEITFVKIQTPGNVTGGGEIRQDEFLAVFKVKVTAPGCYAIVPSLRSYSRLPSLPFFDTDTDVGYVGGALIDCYCFKANEEKTFYVTGQGKPPGEASLSKPMTHPRQNSKVLRATGQSLTSHSIILNSTSALRF